MEMPSAIRSRKSHIHRVCHQRVSPPPNQLSRLLRLIHTRWPFLTANLPSYPRQPVSFPLLPWQHRHLLFLRSRSGLRPRLSRMSTTCSTTRRRTLRTSSRRCRAVLTSYKTQKLMKTVSIFWSFQFYKPTSMSVRPSIHRKVSPIRMKFGVSVKINKWCTIVCYMARSKVKVTWRWRLKILPFSKSTSSAIFSGSWQMTADS